MASCKQSNKNKQTNQCLFLCTVPNEFPGDTIKDGSVVVIKDHLGKCSDKNRNLKRSNAIDSINFQLIVGCNPVHIDYKKAIVIVRNPANAALAEFNRENADGKTGWAVCSRLKHGGNLFMILTCNGCRLTCDAI